MRCVICGARPSRVVFCPQCQKSAGLICDGYLCRPELWRYPHGQRSTSDLLQMECTECQVELQVEDVPARQAFFMHLVTGWRQNMLGADQLVAAVKASGVIRTPYHTVAGFDHLLTALETTVVHRLVRMMFEISDSGPMQLLCEALGNDLLTCRAQRVHPSDRALLVFRFFDGSRGGLQPQYQVFEDPVEVERQRGEPSAATADHQRAQKTNSDVVSVTCSMRNLVKASACCYPCTPGGEVPLMISGLSIYPAPLRAKMTDKFSPVLGLFLLPPRSYICDWSAHSTSVNSTATSTISWYEREVCFDTHGHNYQLGDHLLFAVPNALAGCIEPGAANVVAVSQGPSRQASGSLLRRVMRPSALGKPGGSNLGKGSDAEGSGED